MYEIWYLLRYPKGLEGDYNEKYVETIVSEEPKEAICFKYQRMLRYGGRWNLETRMLIPGCVFLLGTKNMKLKKGFSDTWEEGKTGSVTLEPCDPLFIKKLCRNGNLVDMSKGVIENGKMVVKCGPLKGRERLIRRIDRHKRIAEIEIPFPGGAKRITVGLEIYEKQV